MSLQVASTPSFTRDEHIETTSTADLEASRVNDSQVSDISASPTHTHDTDKLSSDTSNLSSQNTHTTSPASPKHPEQLHQHKTISVDDKQGPTHDLMSQSHRATTNTTYRSSRGNNGSSSPSSHGSRPPSAASMRQASVVGHGELESAQIRAGEPVRRKSHLDATGRRISELSLQLKDRLTYAMIKVQNGWEQHSIDEVESLAASAFSSPATTSTTSMQSPRFANNSLTGRIRGNSGQRDSGTYRSSMSSRSHPSSSRWPAPSPLMQEYPKPQLHIAQQPARVLAPAPDLRPRRHAQPEISQALPVRATTPTAQEKDAVDTLLFMSSPAASQRFTQRPDSHSVHNSPSRGQFSMPRRNLGMSGYGPPTLFDRAGASASASSEEENLLSTSSKRGGGLSVMDERQAKRRSYGRLEDVDRLLDQMRDAASSEEEGDHAISISAHQPVVVRM